MKEKSENAYYVHYRNDLYNRAYLIELSSYETALTIANEYAKDEYNSLVSIITPDNKVTIIKK